MGLHYDILIERQPEGHYIATVRQLPGIQMEGPSPDDLEIEFQEAIRIALDKRTDDGLDFSVRVR